MEKDQIIAYLLDWNFWGANLDIGIWREEYLKRINESLSTKEIIVLSGVRRCGKSTLLLQFMKRLMLQKKIDKKDTLIIYLEDPRLENIKVPELMKIYEAYLSEIRPNKAHYVVLDEIQNVEGWEKFARYLSENKKINVFITGSNSKLLSSEFSTVLSGRYLSYEIMPLSFKEFLLFRGINASSGIDIVKNTPKIKELFEEYLSLGGFPKPAIIPNKNEKNKILTSYYDTIIVKDICLRYNIKGSAKLKELSRFYLTNISKIISMNKIKDSLQLSLETVQRFSEYLESSYLIFFVPKFDYSLKKQIANPKKIYCIDSGIRNNVAFKFSDDLGRVLENTVFVELKRRKKEIYYYKTTNGLEVDFAIKEGKKIKELIQVTENISDFSTREREINSLVKAMKELKIKGSMILTKDTQEEIKKDNMEIKIIPVWKWILS